MIPLLFLDILVIKRGLKLATKVYRKPTHACHYLYFKSNHPCHANMGVVHSLISQAKVIRQDQKDFNNEIKNVRHDLLLNEYSQEFVDSIMKASKSNCPSSDTL
jgi:hypothetical protein